MTNAVPETGYAPVNGLDMHYEIHSRFRLTRPDRSL